MQPQRNLASAASARRVRSSSSSASSTTWRDAFAGPQRWIVGGLVLLILGAVVVTFGWRTVQQQRVAATQAPAVGGPGGAPGPIGAGSSAALPFGKGDARPQPSRGLADMAEEELRAAYLATKDKSSVYQALRDRPEPEAKYLAFRAASDCAGALGGARDASEIDQMVRQSAGNATAETIARRRAAASELAASCRGFLQPGSIPDADMQRLLGEAAAGGHMAAQAALRNASTDQYALVTRAIRSGDPLALADAITPLLRLAGSHRIAGIDVDSRDMMAVRLGIEVAGCRISSTCGAGSMRALAECAYTGMCEAATPADLLLGSPALTASQREMAQSIASQIERAWQKRDVASIVAPRR